MRPTPNDVKRDVAYRQWLNTQPCAICGRFAEYLENGEGRSHAAHVRRNSGVATKPLFSALPLCLEHHQTQHQRGETALMPKAKWDEHAKRYLKLWMMNA